MKIAAIIVTHNNETTLQECIESVRKNSVREIIVVDNASKDATVKVAQKAKVACILQKANLGFAAAANSGAQHVTGADILFLNPDARLEDGSIAKAVRYGLQHPEVGALGLKLVDATGKSEHTAFGNTITPWSVVMRHLVPHHHLTAPTHVGWVSGAAMIVRKQVFEEVAGFDSQFFLYWEDVDLCRRIRQVGWEIVLLPCARAIHSRGHSLSDSRRKTAFYDDSADKYFRKHYATTIWLCQRSLRHLYRLLSREAQ